VFAAIGGLTIKSVMPGALRMRCFYVRLGRRRDRIRQRSISALPAQAARDRVITVNRALRNVPFGQRSDFERILATAGRIF
jgi:hypothetical protein